MEIISFQPSVNFGAVLQLEEAIWRRQIWSSRQPFVHAYGGHSPHTDHLHIGFTKAAVRSQILPVSLSFRIAVLRTGLEDLQNATGKRYDAWTVMTAQNALNERDRRYCRRAWALSLGLCLLQCARQVGSRGEAPTPPVGTARNPALATPAQVTTTRLSKPDCVLLEAQEEGGESTQRCPGISGYQLLALDADSRMSVTLVDPVGKKHPLDYEQVVSHHFTTLGALAKWRTQGSAIALAVPVLANEDVEHPDKTTSYWAVAKITPEVTCVTERLEAAANEAERVETAMAAAADRPCLWRLP